METRCRCVDGTFDCAIQAFGDQDQTDGDHQDCPFQPTEIKKGGQNNGARCRNKMKLEVPLRCDETAEPTECSLETGRTSRPFTFEKFTPFKCGFPGHAWRLVTARQK